MRGSKWCSVSLRVLKIIRLPLQDRNIPTWCSSWTKECKAESKTNLLRLDVGEAISLLPTWLFSSPVDSLLLQTLTHLPYDYYYSFYLPKFPYGGGSTYACQTCQYHKRGRSQALTPNRYSLVLPRPVLFLLCPLPIAVVGPQMTWSKLLPPPSLVLRV